MNRNRVYMHQDGECGCGCGCGSSEPAASAKDWKAVSDSEIICHCAEVTKKDIVDAIQNGAYTASLVKVLTGLGRGLPCPNDHQCIIDLGELLSTYGISTMKDALVSLDPPEQPQNPED